MTALSCALITGIGIWTWLRRLAYWPTSLGLVFGVVQANPTLVMVGAAIGLSFAYYFNAEHFEAQRDRDEEASVLFLVRMRQLLGVTGTLGRALDEMGYKTRSPAADAGEERLEELSRELDVGVLTFFAWVALLVRRHGGSLLPVTEWASQTIQHASALRHARQLEEAAQRSTIIVLALAPFAVLVMFRALVPSFYHILLGSPIGNAALLMVGAVTVAVLTVLTIHIRKEAHVR